MMNERELVEAILEMKRLGVIDASQAMAQIEKVIYTPSSARPMVKQPIAPGHQSMKLYGVISPLHLGKGTAPLSKMKKRKQLKRQRVTQGRQLLTIKDIAQVLRNNPHGLTVTEAATMIGKEKNLSPRHLISRVCQHLVILKKRNQVTAEKDLSLPYHKKRYRLTELSPQRLHKLFKQHEKELQEGDVRIEPGTYKSANYDVKA